jgi:CDP-diacylglycerol--glycerol-3-phosphate 3-phosphatidyltransferase
VNLPNALTLIRIFLVPILVVILLTPFSEYWLGINAYTFAIVIFLAASLTDILDGHLARSRNQVSNLGKLLDPIADKLLISAALIVLVDKGLAPAWSVVVILGREFIVTGLRSVAATEGVVIQAQTSGKIKMWAQCVAIVALLVAGANEASLAIRPASEIVSNFGDQLPYIFFWTVPEVQEAFANLARFSVSSDDWHVFGYLVGRGALWVSVATSLWSLGVYIRHFIRTTKVSN